MLKNSFITFVLALTINLITLFIFGVRANLDAFMINLSIIILYSFIFAFLIGYSKFREVKITNITLMIFNVIALLYLVVFYFMYTPTWSDSVGLIGYSYIATIGVIGSLVTLVYTALKKKGK